MQSVRYPVLCLLRKHVGMLLHRWDINTIFGYVGKDLIAVDFVQDLGGMVQFEIPAPRTFARELDPLFPCLGFSHDWMADIVAEYAAVDVAGSLIDLINSHSKFVETQLLSILHEFRGKATAVYIGEHASDGMAECDADIRRRVVVVCAGSSVYIFNYGKELYYPEMMQFNCEMNRRINAIMEIVRDSVPYDVQLSDHPELGRNARRFNTHIDFGGALLMIEPRE